MKKGVVFFLILWSFQVFSQTVLLSENFDGGGPYAFSSSGSPSWTLNSRLKVSGTYSDTCTIGLSSVSNLTSNSFSTVGYSYVILQFNHICKIENSDKAEIQYSIDNGNTWYALTSAQYLGSGNFTGNKFTEVSYTDWQPGIGGAIPTNSWWKQETFDLSSLVANQSNVKIRFRLSDGNANGANLRTGWYLDDIKIMASASELTPPTITQVTPIWQDTVFQVGPFPVKARINDASGISVAKLYFSINNSSFDSLLMVNTSLDTFVATIPSQPYNTRIDYYIKAWDASPAQNMAQSSAKWFYIKQAPPVVIIGNASTTTYYMPVNGYFKWGWSALLYTASEINKSGIIDSIFFRVSSNTSNFLMENQRMMIGVVPYSSFSDGSMPDSASLTTFYYGNVTWVGPGWFKITPITPFYYNGNSNLLIYWINRRGQYQTGYPVFYATNTSSYRAKYRYSDTYSSVFPTSTGTLTYTRPDIKIVFRLPSTLDLALSSITSPSPSAILEVGTSYDIKVQIKNEGTQTVTSCNLFYSIDNGAPSSYAWSGSLLQGGVSPEITIGSVVFTQPGTHKLKVWVSNPNGQPDQLNLNDTLTINYFVCPFILSGEYTINPLQPTGGTNFGSFRDALNTLRQCGISDTVVMRISPGTYDTILNINYQIPGAGVVGMVIFEGGGSVP
ncbi:MAG: hypothetical protein N2Z72_06985, partial [Bacteroidales bacterium]|nr:hypothetical protein [Bacteroidales bacterium]